MPIFFFHLLLFLHTQFLSFTDSITNPSLSIVVCLQGAVIPTCITYNVIFAWQLLLLLLNKCVLLYVASFQKGEVMHLPTHPPFPSLPRNQLRAAWYSHSSVDCVDSRWYWIGRYIAFRGLADIRAWSALLRLPGRTRAYHGWFLVRPTWCQVAGTNTKNLATGCPNPAHHSRNCL